MSDSIVCGQDTIQRRVVKRDRWWVIETLDGECLSGGFRAKTEALMLARELGVCHE